MAKMSLKRAQKTRYLNSPPQLTDEHILNIAHQAVIKAKIPTEVMSYDDCLDMALFGIAKGYDKFNRDKQGVYDKYANWGSKFVPWISMKAFYAIKDEARKRSLNNTRETPLEESEQREARDTKTPLEERYAEERNSAVRKLLSCLRKKDREIVSRLCLDGESVNKVAKRLNKKRKAVEKRYNDLLLYLGICRKLSFIDLDETDR